MILKCTDEHETILINFLKKERIYNTFILADISYYGFNNEFQKIYMDLDENNKCCFVYLIFHNNLIISGNQKNINLTFILKTFEHNIDIIMGKSELLLTIKKVLDTDEYVFSNKKLYVLNNDNKLYSKKIAKVANASDLDSIHTFLNSISEFNNMYSSKEMINKRLNSNEGNHYILEQDNMIISHANSAAKTLYSCMIGGISTKKEFRGKNYAKKIVSQISKDLLEENITPCLFSERDINHSFFKDIGFELYGFWGTISLNNKKK
ncbi:MAG: GNAT family N-acetyltransferase [Pleomorphochaeta sp.]